MASGDTLNVSVDQMLAALNGYRAQGATEQQCKLIEWAFVRCTHELGRSQAALAGELGYDPTNMYKLFMGTYEGSLSNVCKAIEAARTRAQRTAAIGFVETPVTDRIRKAIDYAHTMSAMVVIRGDTGRGKSMTAKLWHQEHNHGSTYYVELNERSTYARFLRKVGRAMGSSNTGTVDSYRQFIERHLKRNKTLIVDEVGHLYNPKRPDPAPFDFLRSVHDDRKCGLVMIFTLPYWDAITRGPLAGYFEQFLGRVSYELEIPPDTIYQEEITAICADVCRRYGCDPDELLMQQAADIAAGQRGRIRTLIKTLEHAAVFARQQGKPLTGKMLKTARAWRESGGDWSKLTKV